MHAVRTGRTLCLAALLSASILAAPPLAQAQGAPPGMPGGGQAILSDAARFLPVIAPNGMVAAQEAKATRIGVEILERGGNAVDAAVAVGFALAVTLPRAGNLGGGGFMLVHLAERGETVAIDYRETAPAAASPRHVPRRARRARSAQIARFGPLGRRARHRARPRPGARALRLGALHPRRAHRAGRTAGARGFSRRGRSRRFAAARRRPARALPVDPQRSSSTAKNRSAPASG